MVAAGTTMDRDQRDSRSANAGCPTPVPYPVRRDLEFAIAQQHAAASITPCRAAVAVDPLAARELHRRPDRPTDERFRDVHHVEIDEAAALAQERDLLPIRREHAVPALAVARQGNVVSGQDL